MKIILIFLNDKITNSNNLSDKKPCDIMFA